MVNDYFRRWTKDGTLDRLHHAPYAECRELADREASPSAAIIDSQSMKSAEKRVPIDPYGYDAGKKIKGKKRHVLVDTEACCCMPSSHPAELQDRDGGVLLMSTLFGMYPSLLKLYADSSYQGLQFQQARLEACLRPDQRADRQTVRYRHVHGIAQTLDRRENDRQAQPLPPPGKGLGMPEPERFAIPTLGIHPD